MINIKALLAGVTFVIFSGLLYQLIYILLATGYAVVIKEHPGWQITGQVFSYILGGIGYFIIMSSGSYLTAYIAKKHIYLHVILIAILSTGISLFASVREDGFTLNSILFVLLGIAFALVGGYTWTRHQLTEVSSENG